MFFENISDINRFKLPEKRRLTELVCSAVVTVVDNFQAADDFFRGTVVGGAELRKCCIVIAQLGIDIT